MLLLGGLAYVWQRQEDLIAHPPGVDPVAFANLQSEVRSRPTPADQRPAPDLKPLEARVAALEGKSGPDLKPLEARIAALEGKSAAPGAAPAAPPADVTGAVAAAIAPLAQQLDAAAKSDQASQAALAAKVDAATGRLDAASGQAQDAAKQLAARVDALEKQLTLTSQRADQQAAQAARALRAQQALTALESGKPVGVIPDAPPAAARFATTNPPTEADLRLSFPAAAARAADASKPVGANQSIGERMLQHAESLVTVRQGDKVVIGGAAAQTLGLAQQKLDVGDLAGAVVALDGLDPSAAQIMAPWRAQAQSLLDARAALTAMTVAASR